MAKKPTKDLKVLHALVDQAFALDKADPYFLQSVVPDKPTKPKGKA